jgi:hypothetical protein
LVYFAGLVVAVGVTAGVVVAFDYFSFNVDGGWPRASGHDVSWRVGIKHGRIMFMNLPVKAQRVGGSIAIFIPAVAVQELKLVAGDVFDLEATNKKEFRLTLRREKGKK